MLVVGGYDTGADAASGASEPLTRAALYLCSKETLTSGKASTNQSCLVAPRPIRGRDKSALLSVSHRMEMKREKEVTPPFKLHQLFVLRLRSVF